MGNSQSNKAVLSSPNESENARHAFLALLAVETKAQDLSTTNQMNLPKTYRVHPELPLGREMPQGI